MFQAVDKTASPPSFSLRRSLDSNYRISSGDHECSTDALKVTLKIVGVLKGPEFYVSELFLEEVDSRWTSRLYRECEVHLYADDTLVYITENVVQCFISDNNSNLSRIYDGFKMPKLINDIVKTPLFFYDRHF